MEDELETKAPNEVWELIQLPQRSKLVVINGSLRPNVIVKAKSNGLELDLLLKVLLNK